MDLQKELLNISNNAFIDETKLLKTLLSQTKIYQNHIDVIAEKSN